MAKYDGLIIPHSYSDYLNKTDGATLSQMLDSIGGTFDASPIPNSVKPARSGGIFESNAVITSDNATLTGVAISAGSVVRVLFTAALTGSDATTGLTITYNGNTYAVKVGKDGALVALTAHLIEESYIYLQAYTTFELAFDGSQFVVMGNPVVISNADFSIMADGSITHKRIQRFASWHFLSQNKLSKNSICNSLGLNKVSGSVLLQAQSRDIGDSIYQLFNLYWHNTTQVALTTISYKDTILVTVDNTDLTGIASGYYIDLSVIGYNDKY